jgi:hypothetical protein
MHWNCKSTYDGGQLNLLILTPSQAEALACRPVSHAIIPPRTPRASPVSHANISTPPSKGGETKKNARLQGLPLQMLSTRKRFKEHPSAWDQEGGPTSAPFNKGTLVDTPTLRTGNVQVLLILLL